MCYMEKKSLYSQGDLKRIFSHIPANTLLFWAKEGLLTWTDETRDARGIHRKYSFNDLVRVGFVEELLSLGYPNRMIDAFVTNWIELGIGGFFIVAKNIAGRIDGSREIGFCEFWEELPEELAPLRGATSIHVIDVGQIERNIIACLEGV